jgi:hypothetical protein
MKIAINRCYGGFGVSKAVYDVLGLPWDGYGYLENKDLGIEDGDYDAYRADARLVAAIEQVGIKEASGSLAKIAIVEIPDGVQWEIDDYDGMETVHERHRTWP